MGVRDWISGVFGGAAEPLAIAPPAELHPAALDEVSKADAVKNGLTGLGVRQYDKTVNARPSARVYLTDYELEVLHTQGGYARRAVDAPPQQGTRNGWDVMVDDEADPFADEDERLMLNERVRQGWTWARLYGLGGVLMVTDDVDAFGLSADLSAPLVDANVREIKALQDFDARELSVVEYDTDITSPTFRQPLLIQVSPGGRGSGGTTAIVHVSRFLMFRGMQLPPSWGRATDGRDLPVLDAYWDALRNKETLDLSGAGLGQEMAVSVLKIAGKSARTKEEQREYLQRRYRNFSVQRSSVGTAILDKDDEYERHNLGATGWEHLDETARRALTSVEGFPAAWWFGDTPGGLNTDGASWRAQVNTIISGMQERMLRAILLRYYRIQAIIAGMDPTTVQLEFRPIVEPTAAEEADTRLKHAQADAIYLDRDVLTEDEVRTRFTSDAYRDTIQASADDPAPAVADIPDIDPDDLPTQEVPLGGQF